MVLAYEGTGFHGWQRQPGGRRTVQAVIEEAWERICGRPVAVVGAGRTDAGVHALGQVAHAVTATRLGPEELTRALNAHLPEDVVVRELTEVGEGFHARYSARRKRYRYRLHRGCVRPVFERRRSLHVSYAFDLSRMRRAAEDLVGRKDYRAFAAADPARACYRHEDGTVRTVSRAEFVEDGEMVFFDCEADGFLYKMVRTIVGTLLEIGRGRRPPGDISDILDSRDRRRAGPTAPAHGLCLEEVFY